MFERLNEAKRLEQEMEYTKDRVLRKFPRLGVTLSQLKIIPKDEVGTAGTDGKVVYYSPKFFEPLPDDEKAFILAHEVMHVAFNHILRSKDRDHKLWNTATDAVINQILKNEEMPMVEGGVDMEEAINHSAEEMYEKLLKEKEEKEQQKQEQQQNGQGGEGEPQDGEKGDGEGDENEQAGHDNHEIWKEAVKKAEQEQEKQNGQGQPQEQQSQNREQPQGQSQSQSAPEQTGETERRTESDMEKGFANENRQEREEIVQKIREELEKRKNKTMAEMAAESGRSFGAVGEADAALDWKKVLKKSIEEEQDRWSYRRSNADNDYMARVEEMEDEDRAETEVMLDVSGSVDVKLLKEFLRQLKPILKTSKLKVGCFDEHFYGMTEIKTNADIDNFKVISKSGWTENWDLAVKSFSKKKEVNKIIFTDGYPGPGVWPDESTRGVNVMWLVYGNRDFNPVCGKVIPLDPNQVKQSYLNKEAMVKKLSAGR